MTDMPSFTAGSTKRHKCELDRVVGFTYLDCGTHWFEWELNGMHDGRDNSARRSSICKNWGWDRHWGGCLRGLFQLGCSSCFCMWRLGVWWVGLSCITTFVGVCMCWDWGQNSMGDCHYQHVLDDLGDRQNWTCIAWHTLSQVWSHLRRYFWGFPL